MLQESLNNYFIIASIAVGAFSILLIWIYLWETAHGIYIIDFITYKKYINCPFAFSTIMLVILWLTTEKLDDKLIKCFWGLSGAWGITAVVTLIISTLITSKVENKKSIRVAILPCITKVIIMVTVLWLVY